MQRKMKNISLWPHGLLVLFALVFAHSVSAQYGDSLRALPDPNSPDGMNQLRRMQLDPNALVFDKANALRDYSTAIFALHHLLVKDPENAILQDSLATMYYKAGNCESCARWCAEVLTKRPDDLFVRNLAGHVAESIGDHAAAITHYERIYALTRNYFVRYKIAGLQYQAGRFGECGTHIESMLSDTLIDRQAVHIDWEGGGGDVPCEPPC
jgi:tetratricopeptide (TPR) repeat protein